MITTHLVPTEPAAVPMTGSAGRAAADRTSLFGDAWTVSQMGGEVLCGTAAAY